MSRILYYYSLRSSESIWNIGVRYKIRARLKQTNLISVYTVSDCMDLNCRMRHAFLLNLVHSKQNHKASSSNQKRENGWANPQQRHIHRRRWTRTGGEGEAVSSVQTELWSGEEQHFVVQVSPFLLRLSPPWRPEKVLPLTLTQSVKYQSNLLSLGRRT